MLLSLGYVVVMSAALPMLLSLGYVVVMSAALPMLLSLGYVGVMSAALPMLLSLGYVVVMSAALPMLLKSWIRRCYVSCITYAIKSWIRRCYVSCITYAIKSWIRRCYVSSITCAIKSWICRCYVLCPGICHRYRAPVFVIGIVPGEIQTKQDSVNTVAEICTNCSMSLLSKVNETLSTRADNYNLHPLLINYTVRNPDPDGSCGSLCYQGVSNSSLNNLYFIFTCVFVIALVVTLVTNTITVIVIVGTAELRTRTNAFIVSLSVSDILFSVFMIGLAMVTITRHFRQYPIDPVAFQTVTTFAWGIQIHGSNGNLLLVSVERWLYITQPFLYQKYVTTRAVFVSIAATWLVSLAVNIPYLCFGRNDLGSSRSYFIISLAYVNPAIHTACFIILVAIYTHICLITLKHLKRFSKVRRIAAQNGTVAGSYKSSSVHAENWKSIKLLISICGIFFLFVSPYAYFVAYTSTNTSLGASASVWLMFCFLLLTLFHCSNFFVYALGIRLFKKIVKRQFYRLKCCRGSHVSHVRDTSVGSGLDMETRIQNVSYVSSYDN
ncbi:hypothetical protein Btru_030290 [Bulinus truncatus]|nr:hypothetical protein Btru_030290 [Bulinus truncatus]